MDCGGKDGTVKKVAGTMNPQGLSIVGVRQADGGGAGPRLPVADRDAAARARADRRVQPVALRGRAGRAGATTWCRRRTWQARYDKINEFERGAGRRRRDDHQGHAAHLARRSRRDRLDERLHDPTKYWKYNPADLDERALWADYQAAYADALREVLDRGRALVRRAGQPQVVPRLGGRDALARHAGRSGPALPAADFDVRTERARLAIMTPSLRRADLKVNGKVNES